jgi:hypothetical protein
MGRLVTPTLPTDAAERKRIPLARGVFDYWPAALVATTPTTRTNPCTGPGANRTITRTVCCATS